ncbi:MAG: 23S rRNA (guanosine(2251)-2'-O)-methyltransferase RlmB [Pseudomonadales bacterium]|nr:23S rRNA (guanosine(2251)-2'-O)-methyltransferase RlmB [Pseudomonadales bacterium]
MSNVERVYGWHAVRAVLTRAPERVIAVHVAEQRDDPRSRSVLELASRAGFPVRRLPVAQLTKLLGDVAHQGVYAEVRPLTPWGEDELLAALAAEQSAVGQPVPLVLVLDGVQDPHNLGACLRTADACGALAVVVPRDRASQLNATVRKVAAGAAETTPVVAVTNLARSLGLLKEAGLWIVGADATADRLAQDTDLTGALALVMGAEGAGLRQLTRQTCDLLVRLPQAGAVESLNVSVAAGMLLYETMRQRVVGD